MNPELEPMTVGDRAYTWLEHSPAVFGPDAAWSHHGLAISGDGSLIGFDQTAHRLVYLNADGTTRTVDTPVSCAHGITVAVDGQGEERTWLADVGVTSRLAGGQVERDQGQSGVVQIGADGAVTGRLERPKGPGYDDGTAWTPTGVTVDEGRHGGSGAVWVADGYGASVVTRYDAEGNQVALLDGTTGAGRFNCPHAAFIDRRKPDPELLIADRGNGRVQVFDLEGRFKRSFGTDFLISPSAFATTDDLLVIGDLRSRITLVDIDDKLVGHLGMGGDVYKEAGWPNVVGDDGVVSPRPIAAPSFSSPHGLAVSGDGTIYVAEWRIGGRLVELRPT